MNKWQKLNHQRVINSAEFAKVRSIVKARDRGQCKRCGSMESLETHHGTPNGPDYSKFGLCLSQFKSDIEEEAATCTLLCGDCHDIAHGRKKSISQIEKDLEKWLKDY